jgi:hypothetical protein
VARCPVRQCSPLLRGMGRCCSSATLLRGGDRVLKSEPRLPKREGSFVCGQAVSLFDRIAILAGQRSFSGRRFVVPRTLDIS